MSANDLAIDLRHVAKLYKGRGRMKVQALRGVEMQVRRGEVFGLLGPNGAGKSTLVKIMMTVVRPTRAEGTILGQPVGHKPTLAKVGYLPEKSRFPQYLTSRQILHFFGALAKVDRATRKKRVEELLERVGMKEAADRRIGTYSKGMAQRIGLAQTMINEPDLVLLDEPTDGVDPVGRREILDLMSELRRQGKTVFVNSHLLSELEGICDRVAILFNGAVIRQGTIPELAAKNQWYEIELAGDGGDGTWSRLRQAMGGALADATRTAEDDKLPPGTPPPARGKLAAGPWVELHFNRVLRVGTTDAEAVQPMLDAVRQLGLIVKRVQPVRPTLETLFLEAIGAPGATAPAAPGMPPAFPPRVGGPPPFVPPPMGPMAPAHRQGEVR